MQTQKTNRREFLRQGVAAGTALSGLTSASYGRAIGANDRIKVGLIGCGSRGNFLAHNCIQQAESNATMVAVNDIWKHRLETVQSELAGLYDAEPKAYTDYRKLLEDPDVDAVIIATPAHQHCGQVVDAARAGKHIYVEKPIAPLMESLEPLNRCYDVVEETGVVIQHGTHGGSGPATRALKKLFAEGKLGKIFRVESTISSYKPYWNGYTKGPKREDETDWKSFLYGKPDRPFDPDQHSAWMGYYDFSSGPICGWMPHFINFVHTVTGCGHPVAASAFGGIYAPTTDRRRTAPDNVAVTLEYAEGFYTHFVTHFGSSLNNETIHFMTEKGLVRTRFGHDPGNPVFSSEGVNDEIPEQKLLDVDPPYPGAEHFADWFRCIREGGETASGNELGHKQGIAVVMGDTAYRLGRKVVYDKEKRAIRPA